MTQKERGVELWPSTGGAAQTSTDEVPDDVLAEQDAEERQVHDGASRSLVAVLVTKCWRNVMPTSAPQKSRCTGAQSAGEGRIDSTDSTLPPQRKPYHGALR